MAPSQMTYEEIVNEISPSSNNSADHDIEFARRILAARDAQYAAMAGQEPVAWMPIETAPKGGRTLLLGYLNSHGKWRTMRGQWMSQDYIDEYWEDPEGVEAGWFETVVECDDVPNCWPTEPTHWMPLPAAPANPAAQERAEPVAPPAREARHIATGANLEWQAKIFHEEMDKLGVPRDDGEDFYSLIGRANLALSATPPAQAGQDKKGGA